MNTCSTCKWWVRDDTQYHEVNPFYNPITFEEWKTEDERSQFYPFEVRFCKHPKLLFYDRPDKNGAAVFDGSKYMAALATGPDFGCANHEGKESVA